MITEAVLGIQAQQIISPKHISEFEIELKALIQKHFPHWDASGLGDLLR